jgi:hypothetical protein
MDITFKVGLTDVSELTQPSAELLPEPAIIEALGLIFQPLRRQ